MGRNMVGRSWANAFGGVGLRGFAICRSDRPESLFTNGVLVVSTFPGLLGQGAREGGGLEEPKAKGHLERGRRGPAGSARGCWVGW